MLYRIFQFILGFIAIGAVVFIHEAGHFFAAKAFKIDVECLSFGIGPKVLSYKGKNTEYRLSLLPFGGYCKIKGSVDLEKALRDESREIRIKEGGSYFSLNPLERIIIYISGPLINYILAFLLLLVATLIPVEHLSNPAYIAPSYEYESLFHSPIKQDSIKKGDLVLKVDGKDVRDYQEMRALLPSNGDSSLLTILRDGEIIETLVSPTMHDGEYLFGIALYQRCIISSSTDPNLQSGDKVIKVNGEDVYSTLDFYSYITEGENELIIERDGNLFKYISSSSSFPFFWDSDIVIRRDTEENAILFALKRTNEYLVTTFKALGALITFNVDDARDVIRGPVNAADTIGYISMEAFHISSHSGIRTLFYLLAIVSISLTIGNILPIPTFDGGQVLICIAELIKGKNLRPKTYLTLQIVGMLLAIMIVIGMYSLDIKEYFF